MISRAIQSPALRAFWTSVATQPDSFRFGIPRACDDPASQESVSYPSSSEATRWFNAPKVG